MTSFNKRMQFKNLHQSGNPFILMNAWDAGSAKVLTSLGAQAIGTTSAGHSFTLGRTDMGHITRDEALDHASKIVEATDLPVSADFENGFGHESEFIAETVRLAYHTGLAGISIEDTALPDSKPYEFDIAVKRIEACVKAARNMPEVFTLVARADGVMNGHYDMIEAIKRIHAFAEVGADCVYVPCPRTLEELKKICSSVTVPVNALATGELNTLSLKEFAEAGVARISLGSGLARHIHTTLVNSSKKIIKGDFTLFQSNLPSEKIDQLL